MSDLGKYLEELRKNDTKTYRFLQKFLTDYVNRNLAFSNDTKYTSTSQFYPAEGYVEEDYYGGYNAHDYTSSVEENTSTEEDPSPVALCTNSTLSLQYTDFTQIASVRYTFIIIYILVIVISVIGNFMVIWTVTRNKHMRTVTNYYIRNLAVCDFLVAGLVMPLKLLEYTAPCSWQVFAKDALCSVIYYVLPVFVFASVLTLVAISFERYEILFCRCHAIVYPLNTLTVTSKKRTRLILTATWLVPIIVCLPYMYCKGYSFSITSSFGTISRQICTDRFSEIDEAIYGEEHKASGRFRKGFFIFIFITMYLVPMLVIVITCIRIARCLLTPIKSDPQEQSTYSLKLKRKRGESKRRVARMIIAVAIAFIVCWTPFYMVSFISQLQKVSFLLKSNFLFTMLATNLLGFINSAINPLIYHFMSEKFRKSFTMMACSLLCWCPNLWKKRKQGNTSDNRYSWAMKCEEYYCQHRLQKQQHSTSSHSHSKNEMGPHAMTAKYKNNVYNEFGSSSLAYNSARGNSRSPQRLSPKQTAFPNDKKRTSSIKEVTVIKNKKNASFYCGPFCVCHCQGCSLQSSSDSSCHNHKPYKTAKTPHKPKPTQSPTACPLLEERNQQAVNKSQMKTDAAVPAMNTGTHSEVKKYTDIALLTDGRIQATTNDIISSGNLIPKINTDFQVKKGDIFNSTNFTCHVKDSLSRSATNINSQNTIAMNSSKVSQIKSFASTNNLCT